MFKWRRIHLNPLGKCITWLLPVPRGRKLGSISFKEKDRILPTLVETIKQMGFTVTAEGIESLEMADAMRDIGCDFLQGYIFSKPIPADEFAGIYGKN